MSGHKVTFLRDIKTDHSARKALELADGLILIRERTHITKDLLSYMPNLKVISQTGKIGQHIDLDACDLAGVSVIEGVGSPIAPAEFTWLLIMAARRNLISSVQQMKAGYWQSLMGSAVHGDTLGILGYGKVGKIIGRYAQSFGMKVKVWGSDRARNEAKLAGLNICSSREDLFESSDVLTVHLRLAPSTFASIKYTDLLRMKQSALFVNTSRFELIEKDALVAALEKGRPGSAALDVFESEPVYGTGHKLLNMPNVLCTPHMGYVEKKSYEIYFESAIKNLLEFIAGDQSKISAP